MNRRDFFKMVAAASAATAVPLKVLAVDEPRVATASLAASMGEAARAMKRVGEGFGVLRNITVTWLNAVVEVSEQSSYFNEYRIMGSPLAELELEAWVENPDEVPKPGDVLDRDWFEAHEAQKRFPLWIEHWPDDLRFIVDRVSMEQSPGLPIRALITAQEIKQ